MSTAGQYRLKTSFTASAEEKRSALEEVLQSGVFRRAEQLRRFLTFICEMEIEGRADELSEFLIGVEALGRPADYSPMEDAAVRRRAADLREKLQEAYEKELRDAKICIELPKGTYVPRFIRVPASEQKFTRPETSIDSFHQTLRRYVYIGLPSAFLVGALLAWLIFINVPSLRLLVSKSSGISQAHTGFIYEAEASINTIAGAARTSSCGACSGGQKIGFIGNGAANFVAFNNMNVASEGLHPLQVDYLLDGTRSFFISINDGPGIQLPVTSSSWKNPASVSITVPLRAGYNRIVFYNQKDFAPDLDRIIVR